MHSFIFLLKALCFVQVVLLSQFGASLATIGRQKVDERRFIDETSGNPPATRGSPINLKDASEPTDSLSSNLQARAAGTFWLGDNALDHGIMPFAESGYSVFRNIKDSKYGAKGDGVTDDTDAINRAITDGNRCGEGCSGSSTKGALIYFPPGKYLVRRPLVQHFFTQFVGDPNDRAVIIGSSDFRGIAVIDSNKYMDGGILTYTDTNNFYRQIRNIVLDLQQMPDNNREGPDGGLPVGIHWTVAQAASLQNIDFVMRQGSRQVGIFMEQGSGGFVSDLTFTGGMVGWIAGNQQFTARGITFRNCDTAVQMNWDWGFTWKEVLVDSCRVGFNATREGPLTPPAKGNQGTGGLTILDSAFKNTKRPIDISPQGNRRRPSLILDNVRLEGADVGVGSIASGEVLMAGGTRTVATWALGRAYLDEKSDGIQGLGALSPTPLKPSPLRANSKLGGESVFYSRSKPQYSDIGAADVINVLKYGANNANSGDSTDAINRALQDGAKQNKLVVFPSGIYLVSNTIEVPVGTRLVGILWPQIMAVGDRFKDPKKPQVVVRVGKQGEKGVVEISDMLFTTKGNTAGAVLMEWNVHESVQGSAGIWDSIFRVGGAKGSDLDLANCPAKTNQVKQSCMAASLLFHMTPLSSAYLENMWFWVADHDIDSAGQDMIDVFAGRSVLIESKGPTWVHSASSEHAQMYQWQLTGAENIYLGHIQSETPYYQAGIKATEPYPTEQFVNDPTFSYCSNLNSGSTGADTCLKSWALRIINSTEVYVYGGGFYSFFKNYVDACAKTAGGDQCQDKLVDVSRSQRIWVYNIWTIGATELISPRLKSAKTVNAKDSQNGFSTTIAAWIPFGLGPLSGEEWFSDANNPK